jgi:hypothetical protein
MGDDLANRLRDKFNEFHVPYEVQRHYGPGPHPGTGTEQDVHAGGTVGQANRFSWPLTPSDRKRMAAEGILLHGGKSGRMEWQEFPDPEMGWVSHYFVSDPGEHSNNTTQAEHIAGGPFGGHLVLLKERAEAVVPFEPWKHADQAALLERVLPGHNPLYPIPYNDMATISRELERLGGFNRFHVEEPSVQGTSFLYLRPERTLEAVGRVDYPVTVWKHYGPGTHPGTGTEQEVHGGDGGDQTDFDKKVASWRVKVFDLARGEGAVVDKEEQRLRDLAERRVALIEQTADELGFPVENIELYMRTTRDFSIGGVEGTYGMLFDPATGKVQIFSPSVADWGPQSESGDRAIRGMLAHEFQHSTFHQVRDQHQSERAEIDALAREKPGDENDPVWPDGTVKPENEGRWPAYELLEDPKGFDRDVLAREDGFTDYAKQWWGAWEAGNRMPEGIWTVYNESLAEVANMDTMGYLEEVPPGWLTFYKKMKKVAGK